jgi:hypothetical protein
MYNIPLFDYVNGYPKIWYNIMTEYRTHNLNSKVTFISITEYICSKYDCKYIRLDENKDIYSDGLVYYTELEFNSEADALMFKLTHT